MPCVLHCVCVCFLGVIQEIMSHIGGGKAGKQPKPSRRRSKRQQAAAAASVGHERSQKRPLVSNVVEGGESAGGIPGWLSNQYYWLQGSLDIVVKKTAKKSLYLYKELGITDTLGSQDSRMQVVSHVKAE